MQLLVRRLAVCLSRPGLIAGVTALTLSGMNLTNESYVIRLATRNFSERYYRDKSGWSKVSARGRKFRMTAEQVLNHLLPALAGLKPGLTVNVEHHETGARPPQSRPAGRAAN